jgi:hypothetical protein
MKSLADRALLIHVRQGPFRVSCPQGSGAPVTMGDDLMVAESPYGGARAYYG